MHYILVAYLLLISVIGQYLRFFNSSVLVDDTKYIMFISLSSFFLHLDYIFCHSILTLKLIIKNNYNLITMLNVIIS